MVMHRIWAWVLVCALALTLPGTARGAQATDSCDFTITSLPAVATTAGTWCVTANLATSITSGQAIMVGSGVTLDCLDHLIDGSGGGSGNLAIGIRSSGNSYVVIRNCHLRGFGTGIQLDGEGNTVEDNLIEHVKVRGIHLIGDDGTVRRNRVAAVGASTQSSSAYGIVAEGSVLIVDNDIAGVHQNLVGPGIDIGVHLIGFTGAAVIGNRIRNVGPGGAATYGIFAGGEDSQRVSIRGNDLVGAGGTGSVGIQCNYTVARAKNNTINGFVTGIDFCSNSSGNVVRP